MRSVSKKKRNISIKQRFKVQYTGANARRQPWLPLITTTRALYFSCSIKENNYYLNY